MWSSGALKRRVCEVVEGLMAGFTAVTLLFHLSSTCFDNVFTKSHNKMAVAMWPGKTSFVLLYLDFINCTNRSHRFGSRLQEIYKLLFTAFISFFGELLYLFNMAYIKKQSLCLSNRRLNNQIHNALR